MSNRITVTLDGDLADQVAAYAERTNQFDQDAVRTLVELGLTGGQTINNAIGTNTGTLTQCRDVNGGINVR